MIEKGLIDFSSFAGKNVKIVIKELTVLDLDSRCTQHRISPKDMITLGYAGLQTDYGVLHASAIDGDNRWLAKHYHGIGFDAGSVEYESLQSTLREICYDIRLIYSASNEKAKVL